MMLCIFRKRVDHANAFAVAGPAACQDWACSAQRTGGSIMMNQIPRKRPARTTYFSGRRRFTSVKSICSSSALCWDRAISSVVQEQVVQEKVVQERARLQHLDWG